MRSVWARSPQMRDEGGRRAQVLSDTMLDALLEQVSAPTVPPQQDAAAPSAAGSEAFTLGLPGLPLREPSRWRCLAAGCAMMVVVGAVFSFGSIAEDLKHNLQLEDARQLGLISIGGNLGLWGGSFSGGLLADARGPRAVTQWAARLRRLEQLRTI